MTRAILSALMTLVLTACGGGGDALASTPPVQPVESCTPRIVTIQIFGDSTNYGETRSAPGGDPFRVAHTPQVVLQADMDATFGAGAVVVSTDAIPGTTVKMLLDGDTHLFDDMSYQAWPLGATADFVLVNYGINDYNSGMSATDFSAQLAQLSTAHAVVFETPLPTNGETGFAPQVRAAATTAHQPLIDVSAYALSIPSWYSHLPDGTHPDDAGYELITHNAVSPAMVKLVAPLRCVKA